VNVESEAQEPTRGGRPTLRAAPEPGVEARLAEARLKDGAGLPAPEDAEARQGTHPLDDAEGEPNLRRGACREHPAVCRVVEAGRAEGSRALRESRSARRVFQPVSPPDCDRRKNGEGDAERQNVRTVAANPCAATAGRETSKYPMTP
jgi:hypothetical protein